MSPYVRKTKTNSRNKRVHKRTFRSRRSNYRRLARRISAVSRRVAGEVCKFESTPLNYRNSLVVVGSSKTDQTPLNTITSGTPWIMPINWIYTAPNGNATGGVYVDGTQRLSGETITASLKNPIWYNTSSSLTDTDATLSIGEYSDSPGLQYRLKYIYINALFNASQNSDGAVRIVIIKDKQPTGGAATWADLNRAENSRGVFNSDRIDAQLNPSTVGRFKIMYDKTLRFTNINSYKPFKYYKAISSVVRNNRDMVSTSTSGSMPQLNNLNNENNVIQSSSSSPPVQRNAYYLMIFSDGLTFSYTNDSTTAEGNFHLFNRVAYYNN